MADISLWQNHRGKEKIQTDTTHTKSKPGHAAKTGIHTDRGTAAGIQTKLQTIHCHFVFHLTTNPHDGVL